jgi:cytochrome c oxidase assembly protein subunit 11
MTPEKGFGGRNRRVAALATFAVAAMLSAAYAAVPLYAAFCKATGFAGTTQVAKVAPATRGHRSMTVRFDANIAPGLPWSLEPETSEITLRTGATATVYFKARNLSSRPTAAVATFNVSPDSSGAYFDKIACFCFSEQKLGPGESAEWPVVFFLDPKLEQDEAMNDVDAIVLSYTMFASHNTIPPVASAPEAEVARPRL